MSENPLIYKAMIGVMRDVDAIAKDKRNEQQGFRYRGIDDVYNALNSVMGKHGVFTTSEIIEKNREERVNAKGTVMAFTILRIRYTFWAEDGSLVHSEVEGEGMDSGDKSSNKAMAVAHKYALLQAFCIPTQELQQDDPDAQTHEVKPRNGAQVKPIDTGGHPMNTQAAANYVRDQKLAAIAKENAEKSVTIEQLAEQSKPEPKASEDPLWDLINQRVSSGSRADKMQQFEVFRQELSKYKTPEEVQQLFVDALAHVGLQSLDDI